MPLYRATDEKDNCGFGLIADMHGRASHAVLTTSLSALARMTHRGAVGADGKTGDGCGVLMGLPYSFFRAWASAAQIYLTPQFAVGMVFLPADGERATHCQHVLETQLAQELLTVVGWRDVPVAVEHLGRIAHASLPRIRQVIVNSPAGWTSHDLERRLFMARRRTEKALLDVPSFYVCSLSCLVLVYKALTLPEDLPRFYSDLRNDQLQTPVCLFHQRFSTNTAPQWRLAQPFRFLAHNGEINTISGNRAWARARGAKFRTPLINDLQDAAPFVSEDGSDSMSLDNMLEVCLAGGMDIYRALRLLVPPAWDNRDDMDADLRAFYEFNAGHMEPWDGPAGIVMTTGRHVACTLDRNGLRPARYVITRNGWLTLSSEIGVWDYADEDVIEKGRVGPGELLALDTGTGELWRSNAIDLLLKERHPYRHWLQQNSRVVQAEREDRTPSEALSGIALTRAQKMFGVSHEEREMVLRILADSAQEAVGSMGDDTPMAVLSQQPRSIFDFFRQHFAQVTNPPIDPLREAASMTLTTRLGSEHNVFQEATGKAQRYVLHSPVLSHGVFQLLKDDVHAGKKVTRISLNVPLNQPLREAVITLRDAALQAVKSGSVMLLFSDRDSRSDTYPVPALFVVGATHQALVAHGKRVDANLVVETAAARDPHHFAVLLGCGATAIYPWLAYDVIADIVPENKREKALANFRKGINKALLKIMSKMGISAVQSYRGAQLFDAIGLSEDITQMVCPAVCTPVGGISFDTLYQHILAQHKRAHSAHVPLSTGGLLKYQFEGEYHSWNPDVVQALHSAVQSGSRDAYRAYADKVDSRTAAALHDLFLLSPVASALALEHVESAQSIVKCFDSAAMSIGALSREAHETLAMAMNRLGARSNSGEGGEDPRRHQTEKRSRIKQIASGRFGVTPDYLVNADVLQIKMAQGAKPGEGGQLPGEKVTAEIAALRYATPGTTLISPPPHHDIYSIEDLAQLIHDLRCINPQALISVKLVAIAGIGTIACGVAKCGADLITLSGYDGGTGAAPLTSVKYAGSPWELGLAEAHQALIANGLRQRVLLQVDGGFKTGLDVVKAALLGADSFGFGTAPMIAMGCKYLRICHLNNCATGVATQNETLRREHFAGDVEKVVNFFLSTAEDVRHHLAAIGLPSLAAARGRVDALRVNSSHALSSVLELNRLLDTPLPQTWADVAVSQSRMKHADNVSLNAQIQQDVMGQLLENKPAQFSYRIRNHDRTIGASLSGDLSRQYGQARAPHAIELHFNGVAGQSFAAFNQSPMHLFLRGDANDYVGKGMHGGRVVLMPPDRSRFATELTPIMGNTCLYGATGGELFANGRAGERFAVRNSGAVAVIEGCGDHGCEYMTGGAVIVLGKTGRNFAAGMSGGVAFVHDPEHQFTARVNTELVDVQRLRDVHDVTVLAFVRDGVQRHAEWTGSRLAAHLLREWSNSVQAFYVVKPKTLTVSTALQSARIESEIIKVKGEFDFDIDAQRAGTGSRIPVNSVID